MKKLLKILGNENFQASLHQGGTCNLYIEETTDYDVEELDHLISDLSEVKEAMLNEIYEEVQAC